MKRPTKVSIKVQRIFGTLSRTQSSMSITFNCIFSGEDYLWFFLQRGNIISVTFIHIYRKYHISMFFLRKIIFHFPSKKKYHIFRNKNTIFLDNTRKIIFQRDVFGKTIYSGHLKKYHLSMYFFEKDHLSCSV